MPNMVESKFRVSHEAAPGLSGATRITRVNDNLKVIGFQSGAVVPLTNYGHRKTFHCDVRGRFNHHAGEITCLAANLAGTKVASGCSVGTVALFQARESEISFLSKVEQVKAGHLTDMCFYKPGSGFPYGNLNQSQPEDDSLLIMSGAGGLMELLDTRCKLAQALHTELLFRNGQEDTVLTFSAQSPSNLFYLGTGHSGVLVCDIRQKGKIVQRVKHGDSDCCIRKLREIMIWVGARQRSFIVYINDEAGKLHILDKDTLKYSTEWICERDPGERIRDFTCIDERIIACGDNMSIGCWAYERPSGSAAVAGDD